MSIQYTVPGLELTTSGLTNLNTLVLVNQFLIFFFSRARFSFLNRL